jgi:hypothetical protein
MHITIISKMVLIVVVAVVIMKKCESLLTRKGLGMTHPLLAWIREHQDARPQRSMINAT